MLIRLCQAGELVNAAHVVSTFMKLIKRKAIAEWHHEDGVWLVMWPSGRVEAYMTPKAVMRAIRRTDATCTRVGIDAIVTTIEWRNPPSDFKPPETN